MMWYDFGFKMIQYEMVGTYMNEYFDFSRQNTFH